jgi:hypothetical protein
MTTVYAYSCNECKKTTNRWIRLGNGQTISLTVAYDGRQEIDKIPEDAHFCSLKCVFSYLEELMLKIDRNFIRE